MTTLQSITRARAETFRTRMRKLAAALGAVAAMLLPAAAWGMDSAFKPTTDRAGQVLPLPPIPYLESMQWMSWKPSQPLLRIDTLLGPATPEIIFQAPSWDPRTLEATS